MMKSKRRWLLACMVVAVPTWGVALDLPESAKAQVPGTLTVEQALALGLRHNPQVSAGVAGVSSLLATYRSLIVPSPITLGASQVQGTSTAPTLSGDAQDTIIDVSGTLDTSGQRRYQAAGANAAFKVSRYQFYETVLSLEQQIRDAYWSLSAAQAQTQIAKQSLDQATYVFGLTETQEKAGASPHGDVIRSSIDVANSRQALLAVQSGERTALIALNTLLGEPPLKVINLASDLADPSFADREVNIGGLDRLQSEAISNRPLIKASSEQIHSADYSVRQTEASRIPDLNLTYQRSLQQQVDSLTFSISFPLLDFGGISQAVKAARELRKQAEAQKVQAEQQVMQQVTQAQSDLETATQAAVHYKTEILDPSTKLLEIAQLGYKQGATGILPVIDAESTIRNARTGYINSILAIMKAKDEVIAAVGRSTYSQLLTTDQKKNHAKKS